MFYLYIIKFGDKMNRKLYNEIKVLQKKLDKNIDKNGLKDKQTIETSDKIEELINNYYNLLKKREYPTESIMKLFYDISYEELKKNTIVNQKFPEVSQWNKYAREYGLLSAESIKYISMLDWKYLRVKVNREINMKIFWKKFCVAISSVTQFF